jgi:hypothetical protein
MDSSKSQNTTIETNKSHQLTEDELDLSEKISLLIQNYEKFVEILKINKSKNELLIHEDVSKHRNQIDLDVEMLKVKLDETRDRMFQEIDSVVKDFKSNNELIKTDDKDDVLSQLKTDWSKLNEKKDANQHRIFLTHAEVEVERIKDDIQTLDKSCYKALMLNYRSDFYKSNLALNDFRFGEVVSSKPTLNLDEIFNEQFEVLFKGDIKSDLIILYSEKANLKISLSDLKAFIESQQTYSPRLLKADEFIYRLLKSNSNKSIISSSVITGLIKNFVKHLDFNISIKSMAINLLCKITFHNPKSIEEVVNWGGLPLIVRLVPNQEFFLRAVFLLVNICSYDEICRNLVLKSSIFDYVYKLFEIYTSNDCKGIEKRLLGKLFDALNEYPTEVVYSLIQKFIGLIRSSVDKRVLGRILSLMPAPSILNLFSISSNLIQGNLFFNIIAFFFTTRDYSVIWPKYTSHFFKH